MARDFTPSDRLVAASAAVTAYPVTLAAWCRPSVVDAYQGIVALGVNGASNASSFQLRVANTGVLQARAVDSGGSGSQAVSSSISSNAWSHAAGVFVSDTRRTVYLNGTSNSNTASRTVNPSAFAYSTIGCHPVTGSYGGFFEGRIAEAAWWAAELTADEIEMLAAGYSPLFVRPAALRAYVPLFGRGGASGHEEDWVGGLTFEQTGSPTVADHPRIIYPGRRIIIPVGAAASSGGVGSSAGTSTASAVGASFFAATGSSAGTSTAAATGASLRAAAGSSVGVVTVTAVGASRFASVGSLAGTATASAVGASLFAAIGSSTGIAAATAAGASLFAAFGTAAGSSTVAAVGASSSGSAATGSSAGSSTAAAVGTSIFAASGNSAGVAAASAAGRSLFAAFGTAAGTSTASAVGASGSIGSGVGSASGTSTAAAVGEAIAQAAGISAGVATVSGVSSVASPVTGKFGKAIAVPNTGISMPTGLGVADHQDFDFGTGDFTIDLWAYRTANTYVGTLFYGTLGGGEFSVKVGTDGLIDLIYRSSGESQSFSNVATWPLEKWVYFVVQRRGTNWETYLNGVLIHSAAITGGASSTVNSGGDLFFGRTNVSSVQSWNGYLDDIRVTRGAARNGDYYAPQLPTAEFPTNATGDRHWDKVRLLLKGEGATIVDSSSAARAISVLLGTPATSTEQFVFGSRSIKMAVGAAAVQLRVDIGAAAENKAWTYEAWAYLTSRQTYTAFLSDDDANNAIMLRTPNNSGNYQLCILFGGAATYWALDPDPFPLNTWTHFAFCVMPGGHPVVLFVNGVKKAESPGVIATRSVYQPSGLTRIGRNDNAGFSGFPGYLEEARLTLGVARYTTDFPPPLATFCESVSSVVSPKPEATLQGRILKLTQGLLDPSLPPSDFAPVTGAVFYGSSSGTPRWVEWHLTPSGEILVATNEDPVPSWRVSSYSSPYYPHLWGTPVTPDVGTNYEVEFSYEDPQQFNVAYSGSQLNTRLSLASTRTVRVTNTNDFALTFERIVAKIYTSAGAHVGTVTLVSGISVLATTPVQPPLRQEAQSFSPSFVVVKVNPVQVGDYNNRALTLNPDGTVTFSPPYPDSGDARLPGLVAWLQNAPSGVDGRYYNVTLTRSGKVGLAGELVPGVSKDLSVSKTVVVFAPAFNAFGVSRIRLAFSPNNLHPAQALGTTSAYSGYIEFDILVQY